MEFDNIVEKVIYNKIMSHISNNENIDIEKNEDISKNNIDQVDCTKYYEEIIRNLQVMERTRINTSNRPIPPETGIIKKIIKRVIRKILRWYIEPICIQQTEFNNTVIPVSGRVMEILQYQAIQIEHLTGMINQLNIKNDELSNTVRLLDDKNKNNNWMEHNTKLIQLLNNQIDTLLITESYKEKNISLLTARINELENNITLLTNQIKELEKNNIYINKQVISIFQKLTIIDKIDLPLIKDINTHDGEQMTSSQAGEDSIISFILMMLQIPVEQCKYLDLGANHAIKLSNTYRFYSQGARGVLVEANPALIPELKFFRHNDVIVNKCVSTNSNEFIDFYILNGDGLSTPDKEAVDDFIAVNPLIKINNVVKIETITVNDIIDKYLGCSPTILNIDIEGKDLEILNTIDWDKYRPLIVIAEMIDYRPTLVVNEKNIQMIKFMNSKKYVEFAFTGINSIFIDMEALERRQ